MFVDQLFLSQVDAIREATDHPTLIYLDDGDVPDGVLGYEALIDGADPTPDAGLEARIWPASSTPAAPPDSPRGL